jgi:hypothetical protein
VIAVLTAASEFGQSALLLASAVFIVRALRKSTIVADQPPLRRGITLAIGVADGFIVGATSVGSGSS